MFVSVGVKENTSVSYRRLMVCVALAIGNNVHKNNPAHLTGQVPWPAPSVLLYAGNLSLERLPGDPADAGTAMRVAV